jgi:thymidine kinase
MALHLILGPMFSAKTTELIRQYNRNTLGGKKCLMIKYEGDTRYGDDVTTHDGVKVKAIKAQKLESVDENVSNYDVICVDEVQFYTDADIYCDKWANAGKYVYACGLSGTFKRTPFPIISNLIAKADKVKFLTAICQQTGKEAPFTKLIVPEKSDSIEIIGGAEKYIAVDRYTYTAF